MVVSAGCVHTVTGSPVASSSGVGVASVTCCVNPLSVLQSAQHLLFFAKLGSPFALALTGTVVDTSTTSLTLQLATLQSFPGSKTLKGLTQQVTLATPTPLDVSSGESLTVWTQPALATLKTMLGQTLSVALVSAQKSSPGASRRMR